MADIRDVARHAGVSPITVSRVVNGSPLVRPETKDRVDAAIRDLNYIPNAAARGLKQSRSGLIALLITDINSAFFSAVARGAEDAARAAGLNLVHGNSDEDAQIEARYLRSFGELRVDGLIVVPTPDAGEMLRSRMPNHIPIVLFDRHVPGSDAPIVRCDTQRGTYELCNHILSLGHRRIALAHGQPITETWFQRVEGYRRAMREAGIPQSDMWEIEVPRMGLSAMEVGRIAAEQAVSAALRPQVVIASNAGVAVGLVEEFHRSGLRVPEDIGVASIDDPIPFESTAPFWGSMTCIVQPGYAMGRKAAEILIEFLNGVPPKVQRDYVFNSTLRIGTSCGELLARVGQTKPA